MPSIKSLYLLAGVGVASALSIGGFSNPLKGLGVSSSCQQAILGVQRNREASSCLNLPGVTAILTLQANYSAIPSLNTWLQGACRADPCSNNVINSITGNITTACKDDIAKAGIPENVVQTIVRNIPKFYPTVRNIACLKTASNNTLCATSALLDVQQALGKALRPDSAMEAGRTFINESIIPKVECTGCALAAFNIFKADQPVLANKPAVTERIAEQCGAQFLTTPQPSDVVEGTGSAAPSTTLTANLASHNGGLSPTPGIFAAFTATSLTTLFTTAFLFMN